MQKWKEIAEEYEVKYAEFVKANETYQKAYEDYKGDLKQYEEDLKDSKKDPYGEEDALKEPEKPVKPDEPAKPPPSPVSVFEMQSVGRVYFNLTKPEMSRWKKLVPEQVSKRPQNMGIWWELYEKYERELIAFHPFEDDDEELVKKVSKDKEKDKEKEKEKEKSKKDKKSKVNKFQSIFSNHILKLIEKGAAGKKSKDQKDEL